MKKCLVILGVLLSLQVYAETYQWTDEKGVVHYSDKPVHGDAKQVKINTTKAPKQADGATQKPDAVKQAAKTECKSDRTQQVESALGTLTVKLGCLGEG